MPLFLSCGIRLALSGEGTPDVPKEPSFVTSLRTCGTHSNIQLLFTVSPLSRRRRSPPPPSESGS